MRPGDVKAMGNIRPGPHASPVRCITKHQALASLGGRDARPPLKGGRPLALVEHRPQALGVADGVAIWVVVEVDEGVDPLLEE